MNHLSKMHKSYHTNKPKSINDLHNKYIWSMPSHCGKYSQTIVLRLFTPTAKVRGSLKVFELVTSQPLPQSLSLWQSIKYAKFQIWYFSQKYFFQTIKSYFLDKITWTAPSCCWGCHSMGRAPRQPRQWPRGSGPDLLCPLPRSRSWSRSWSRSLTSDTSAPGPLPSNLFCKMEFF